MSAEQIILERIVQGDLSAFDQLYSLYGKPLYAFVYRYVRSTQEAEDVVQETFLRLVQMREEIPLTGCFKTWLYTVARNLSLNRLRSQNSRRAKQEQIFVDFYAQNEISEQAKWDERWVRQEVNALSHAHQEIYRMRSLGLSYQEMAHRLGIPEGTVKSRMHEMIKTLKERWETWNVN